MNILFFIILTGSVFANTNDSSSIVINLKSHETASFGIGYQYPGHGPKDIHAMFSGIVFESNNESNNLSNLGKYVILKHEYLLNNNFKDTLTLFSVYAMLSKINVRIGDSITAGNTIGEVGPSGPLSNLTNDDVIIGVFSKNNHVNFNKLWDSESLFLHEVYWYDFNSIFDAIKNDKILPVIN